MSIVLISFALIMKSLCLCPTCHLFNSWTYWAAPPINEDSMVLNWSKMLKGIHNANQIKDHPLQFSPPTIQSPLDRKSSFQPEQDKYTVGSTFLNSQQISKKNGIYIYVYLNIIRSFITSNVSKRPTNNDTDIRHYYQNYY